MSEAPTPGALLDPGLVRTRSGTVASFDDAAGFGEVAEASGDVHPFHCTAISGGTRSIEPGTPVHFVLGAYHGGRFQAFDLAPLT